MTGRAAVPKAPVVNAETVVLFPGGFGICIETVVFLPFTCRPITTFLGMSQNLSEPASIDRNRQYDDSNCERLAPQRPVAASRCIPERGTTAMEVR